MEIQGQFDEKFAPVVEVFGANLESGADVGASFAATVDGEFVIDVWGGYRDAAASEPWESDTIVNVYSTTKTMSFLTALLLADRGELEFDAPVARYWPEFAANGKDAVEVRHLMSHSAGLSGLQEAIEPEDLYDWEKITSLLAAQAPWWEPGTQSGYHAITQGYLIGEVVRRISGRTIGTFFREEIAEPLGADFHIGLDPSEFRRVGELIPPSEGLAEAADADSVAARTFRSPQVDARASQTDAWRRAEIPAAGGHGNARAVVRAQTPLANGGSAFGHTLMSEQGARLALTEQTNGEDLVLGVPMRFGLGYGLNGDIVPISPNENAMFWGGWGGSTIVVDFDARACLSYVMNRMEAGALGDPRGFKLNQTFYRCLG